MNSEPSTFVSTGSQPTNKITPSRDSVVPVSPRMVYPDLGLLVRRTMKGGGLSFRELAREIGISKSGIHRAANDQPLTEKFHTRLHRALGGKQ